MIRYAIFFLLISAFRLSAQEKFWIYFADKGSAQRSFLSRSPASAGEAARSLNITAHAMERRALRAARPGVDEEDLPIAPEYLSSLRRLGILPLVESRWLNAVSARLTDADRARVLAVPGVRSIEPVRVYRSDSLASTGMTPAGLQKRSSVRSVSSLDYGPSFDQVELINVPRVHSLDINGRGVIVGMLDAGFRWREHESLKNLHVIGEYDFIQNDTVTANQPGDSADEDDHGTKTMSTLGGYMPGALIGPAYGASFMLGKTEYVPAELNSEEDNWVAGLEWLERGGADVVSSSLGYSEFDPGQHSYTYQDMNGHTATTTRAAAVAARKGVLVCVAMGNEALHAWHYLTSPADADSIISVGAVTGAGDVAVFSSVGPTSDGRTKPDVCARGVDDVCAQVSPKSESMYAINNGTSLSTPLVAGAATLILSARPEMTPIDVRNALRSTASNALTPNNSIGWGIIDTYKALMAKGLLISAQLSSVREADSSQTVSVHILSPSALVGDSLLYHYSIDGASTFITGRLTLQTVIDSSTASGVYTFLLPKNASHFYLSAADQQGVSRLLPSKAPAVLYNGSSIVTVVSPQAVPQSFVLWQNFPNPFNGETTIRYDLPSPTRVTITVYDVLGRRVVVLVNEQKDAGSYFVKWSAPLVSSGVFFYTIRTNDAIETKKMIVVR
jgi:serine protease AprX